MPARTAIKSVVVAAIAIAIALGLTGETERLPVTDTFVDVADRWGIGRPHQAAKPCGFNAVGAAWGDVDSDRDLDLFLPQQRGPSLLWVRGGGARFSESAERAGLARPGAGTAASFADYDNDGDQDLYVGVRGRNRLYRNDGRGRFDDVTRRAGVGDRGPTNAVSWTDFDGDGQLDLYVANGDNCDDPVLAPDRLYRNRGDGTFDDVARLLPVGVTQGITLAVAWFDYDQDGDSDLYLANDFLGFRGNTLLRNEGGDGFTDIGKAIGADANLSSMGVAVGDVTRDGMPDLAISDIGREALFVGQAGGRFKEEAAQRGFGRSQTSEGAASITWELSFADFDNDTDLDSYATAGPLGLDKEAQPDLFHVNDGRGSFQSFEVDQPGSGRTVALADWNEDGRVDVLVAQLAGVPLMLENRSRKPGHWITFRLEGTRSARDACGARVTVRAGGRHQSRELQCGHGERIVRFGLGGSKQVDRVEVRWPAGGRQLLGPLRAGQLVEVRERSDR